MKIVPRRAPTPGALATCATTFTPIRREMCIARRSMDGNPGKMANGFRAETKCGPLKPRGRARASQSLRNRCANPPPIAVATRKRWTAICVPEPLEGTDTRILHIQRLLPIDPARRTHHRMIDRGTIGPRVVEMTMGASEWLIISNLSFNSKSDCVILLDRLPHRFSTIPVLDME